MGETVGRREKCPGCGLVTEAVDGPVHAYIGASAGCWQQHSRLLTVPLMPSAQIAVDTYAVQHPGTKERRSTQSVAVHLLSLCAVLERDFPRDRSIDLLRHAVGFPQLWHWLHPHTPIGHLTVADVLAQARPGGGALVLRAWAEDVWDAYAPHHATVRGWLDQVLATWDR